ncbi:MAG: amidohydrolase family protein, partial [bacterium]|nr:amidohydrolase family protein [bacterium]
LYPETTIIKNANIYLPNNTWQADSFVLLEGCKIKETGLMKQLKETIYDTEYDAAGGFVYPAFIDSYYTGFQKKKAVPKKKGGKALIDKDNRQSLQERNWFILNKAVDNLELSRQKRKKLLSKGFAFAHIVPAKGIISGTTCLVSLAHDKPQEAVLVPDVFMTLFFKTNNRSYPSNYAALATELKQLKEDSIYNNKMKKHQFFDETRRAKYRPELEQLLPYFSREKNFLIMTRNVVEQRIAGLLRKDLNVNPVLGANPDIWRRPVDNGAPVILPLNFTPPVSSRYALMGDKLKKKAEKKIYPQKIVEFFKTHKNISLTAPKSGDYKTLFKNIRTLVKLGVPEVDIINALTVTPAKLMGISQFAGSIKTGKLASLFVADKKIFEDKAKIKTVFLEGTLMEFKSKKGSGKPPAADLTGKWNIEVVSANGTYQLKMNLQQEGSELSGEINSPMLGTIQVEEGTIDGDEISFSANAAVMGQEVTLEVSASLKDGKIDGSITLGTFGEGTFSATRAGSPEKKDKSSLAIQSF